MKSPITGKKMKKKKEVRTIMGLSFLFEYYLCLDSGEKFTTTKLDESNYDLYHKEKRTT